MFIPWNWRVPQGSPREHTARDPQLSAWGSRGRWGASAGGTTRVTRSGTDTLRLVERSG